MGWREIIYQYLLACLGDSQRESPPKRRAQFMDEHGTSALKQREQEKQTRLDTRVASQQVPHPDTYKVIEESPTRVIAEIEKTKDLMELEAYTNRFLVVNVDGQWKLEDVFWKCFSCKDGHCHFCEGKGSCCLCKGTGFTRHFFGLMKMKCILCQGNPTCQFCKGTGRCTNCSQDPIPGWMSRTSIHPEDNASD